MVADYDAKSVAEVLGIAFLRHADAGAAAAGGDFVIYVDGGAVSVVQAEAAETAWPAPPSPVMIEKAVERGLPRQALRHVAEWLAGDDPKLVSSVERGVVPKAALSRQAAQLSPAASERTERFARLFVHARRALGSDAEARAFMTAPHPELDGRSPVDAARTDLGARRAERILNALEYGLAL